jgi:hypothetical protein
MPEFTEPQEPEVVVPDPSGIPDGEVPVEKVEHLGDALRRLVQGAGKTHYDVCFIETERARSFDGTVGTEIKYPFGFTAKLQASTLRSVLQHVRTPKFQATPARVTFSEDGKKFQLGRLVRDIEINDWPPATGGDTIRGEWLTRLLPILPTRSGHQSFSGIYACPEGFVGTDSSILVWVEVAGPPHFAIIPRQLVSRLPSGEVKLQVAEDHSQVWVVDEDTTWRSPTLHGEFPAWKAVFTGQPNRVAIVARDELLEALKAVTSVDPHAYVVRQQGLQRLVLRSVNSMEARTLHHMSSIAQVAVTLKQATGEDFQLTLDVQRMLSALDKTKGALVSIATDDRQDRAYVRPLDMTPKVHIMLMGITGFGAMPVESEA